MLKVLELHSGIRTVTLCLDNDEAGAFATERLTGILRERGYTDVRVMLPALKDWNDVLCAAGEAAQERKDVLRFM